MFELESGQDFSGHFFYLSQEIPKPSWRLIQENAMVYAAIQTGARSVVFLTSTSNIPDGRPVGGQVVLTPQQKRSHENARAHLAGNEGAVFVSGKEQTQQLNSDGSITPSASYSSYTIKKKDFYEPFVSSLRCDAI